ncbi:MAG: hypothetical protein HC779_02460 [Phyllobacteriaceae bacterium]|nr:hypothetical protein [Phyllobacteriaceae bacterium]
MPGALDGAGKVDRPLVDQDLRAVHGHEGRGHHVERVLGRRQGDGFADGRLDAAGEGHQQEDHDINKKSIMLVRLSEALTERRPAPDTFFCTKASEMACIKRRPGLLIMAPRRLS